MSNGRDFDEGFCKSLPGGRKENVGQVPLTNLEKVLEFLERAYQSENQIFVMGNGGAGPQHRTLPVI
jgi:hypothetical protein